MADTQSILAANNWMQNMQPGNQWAANPLQVISGAQDIANKVQENRNMQQSLLDAQQGFIQRANLMAGGVAYSLYTDPDLDYGKAMTRLDMMGQASPFAKPMLEQIRRGLTPDMSPQQVRQAFGNFAFSTLSPPTQQQMNQPSYQFDTQNGVNTYYAIPRTGGRSLSNPAAPYPAYQGYQPYMQMVPDPNNPGKMIPTYFTPNTQQGGVPAEGGGGGGSGGGSGGAPVRPGAVNPDGNPIGPNNPARRKAPDEPAPTAPVTPGSGGSGGVEGGQGGNLPLPPTPPAGGPPPLPSPTPVAPPPPATPLTVPPPPPANMPPAPAHGAPGKSAPARPLAVAPPISPPITGGPAVTPPVAAPPVPQPQQMPPAPAVPGKSAPAPRAPEPPPAGLQLPPGTGPQAMATPNQLIQPQAGAGAPQQPGMVNRLISSLNPIGSAQAQDLPRPIQIPQPNRPSMPPTWGGGVPPQNVQADITSSPAKIEADNQFVTQSGLMKFPYEQILHEFNGGQTITGQGKLPVRVVEDWARGVLKGVLGVDWPVETPGKFQSLQVLFNQLENRGQISGGQMGPLHTVMAGHPSHDISEWANMDAVKENLAVIDSIAAMRKSWDAMTPEQQKAATPVGNNTYAAYSRQWGSTVDLRPFAAPYMGPDQRQRMAQEIAKMSPAEFKNFQHYQQLADDPNVNTPATGGVPGTRY